MHTVKWFQVLLYNSNNLSSAICLHTFSIWPIDGTLSCSTTLGQSWPGSNINERVLHIPQISSFRWFHVITRTLVRVRGWSYSLCRDTVGYSTAPADSANIIWVVEWNINKYLTVLLQSTLNILTMVIFPLK